MTQAQVWMGTDIRTQPRVWRDGATFAVDVTVGIWTDFHCPPESIDVRFEAEIRDSVDNSAPAPFGPLVRSAHALTPDLLAPSTSPARTWVTVAPAAADGPGTDLRAAIQRWDDARRFATIGAEVHDLDRANNAGRNKYAAATFAGLEGDVLVVLTARVSIAGQPFLTVPGWPVWTVDPPDQPTEISDAFAPVGVDDHHCWVLLHRRRDGLDQFRVDLLTVNDSGMPVDWLRLQLGGVDLELSTVPSVTAGAVVGVWVDPRSPSVHLTVPGSAPVREVTLRTDIGDGRPRSTTVVLDRPSVRPPAALMIIAYAIQGLNDLFWRPVRAVDDELLDEIRKTQTLNGHPVSPPYRRPRDFADIVYRDENAVFSGKPDHPENRIPDGYAFMLAAQRRYGTRAVWAFNAGALLLLRGGLPTEQWQELVGGVHDGLISPGLAGFGAHRAGYYRSEINAAELIENDDLIKVLLGRSNRVYFGDSRIYLATPGETAAFAAVSDRVRYLVLERSTIATPDTGSPTGERLLFPRQDLSANRVWQDVDTGLRLLLGEDVLRNGMMNPDAVGVGLGRLPAAVRRLLMQAYAEGRPERLLVCADDIEHYCGAGWFDGQGSDFAAGYTAALAWIAEHPWVQTVVPDANVRTTKGRSVPFERRFHAQRLAVSSSTDAAMDPEGASVRHQGERLLFDLWHRAWREFRVPWLGCTLGEISSTLEDALVGWADREPAPHPDLLALARLYFLTCTHENCWSKQPTGSRSHARDDPFCWEPEDFVISETVQMRNAWVYLNASIWAADDAAERRDGADHVLSTATVGSSRSGWLTALIRKAHGADRWWTPNRPQPDDGLYWDRDNLPNTILYNDDLLAVLDENGGVISHLFARQGGRAVSVSGTCKAYQFLSLNPQIPCDGLRVQNTVFTPNHAYLASDVRQALPVVGTFANQNTGRDDTCWWPNNLDRYQRQILPDATGVRFCYGGGHPDPVPPEPIAESALMALLTVDGQRLRAGETGIVLHRGPPFSKEIRLEGRTLTIRYGGVRPDHLVANEFTVDLLSQLRGGAAQRVDRRREVVSIRSDVTTVRVRSGDGAEFVQADGTVADGLRERVLTSTVLVGPRPGRNSFTYTVEVDGPTP